MPAFFMTLLIGLWAGNAFASHGAVSVTSGHTGPITTVGASTLGSGDLGIDLQSEYISFDQFSTAELLGFAETDREIHDVDYLLIYYIGLSYGVTDGTTVHLRLPYFYRNDISESEPPDEIHHHGDAKGFGDLSVYVHQKLYDTPSRDFSVTLLAGLEMPTGKTNDRDDHGETFEAEFLPGSGSWDPSLGLAMTKRIGQIAVDGNVFYTLVTEGTQDTDLGDIFAYNLAVSYRALKAPLTLDIFAELNGIWRDKEETDGHKDPDSGGNTIFFSPGLKVGVWKGVMFYGSYSIPIAEDLNGIQNETDYRLVFGLNFLL
jgi:hypothetical protein